MYPCNTLSYTGYVIKEIIIGTIHTSKPDANMSGNFFYYSSALNLRQEFILFLFYTFFRIKIVCKHKAAILSFFMMQIQYLCIIPCPFFHKLILSKTII